MYGKKYKFGMGRMSRNEDCILQMNLGAPVAKPLLSAGLLI